MIEVKNLVKRYGDHTAVDHLSFEIEKGKIYGFLGPNGAGKSTTMNMITGYIASTEGTVVIDGHDILEEPEEAKKCIGYLPEMPPLYFDMTVLEYLKFVADLKKIPKDKKASMIEEIMDMVKITDMKNRLIKNLSKGYRQRVGIAQAVLGYPEVIILSLFDQINYIDEQERVRLLREDFSYAMVHDMKSPLTSIIMGTKYLHSGVLEKKPEMKEKYFCIVEDEAQHLLALINRLLTISKLEHGKLHIQKAEVNLETMIEDVVDKYKAKSAKPIHITTRFGATSALADEEYLKEAISNLVDNATKYSKEDINIEISTLEDDRNVYIKVFDEGIGIAKSELKTIFNRFERAAEHEKDARKTRGGFGIGLNYVLQVINAHSGKISVKSEKDKWSEFTISLPK